MGLEEGGGTAGLGSGFGAGSLGWDAAAGVGVGAGGWGVEGLGAAGRMTVGWLSMACCAAFCSGSGCGCDLGSGD
jgi:hypothetical protein